MLQFPKILWNILDFIDLNQVFTGQEIRIKRKKLGLSAQELADIIGVSKSNLYKWEKGHKPQTGEDYLKVEKWLYEIEENVPRDTPSEVNDHPAPYLKTRPVANNI